MTATVLALPLPVVCCEAAMTPCKLWTGYTTKDGYGSLIVDGKRLRLTRYVWRKETGQDPGALHVLHSCDQPLCYELSHLRLGTHADNMRDKVERGRCRNQHLGATVCKRGHPFDSANTYIFPSSGNRLCKACNLFRRHTVPCPLCKGKRSPPLRGRIFGSFLGCPCCEGKGRVARDRAEFFLHPECPF